MRDGISESNLHDSDVIYFISKQPMIWPRTNKNFGLTFTRETNLETDIASSGSFIYQMSWCELVLSGKYPEDVNKSAYYGAINVAENLSSCLVLKDKSVSLTYRLQSTFFFFTPRLFSMYYTFLTVFTLLSVIFTKTWTVYTKPKSAWSDGKGLYAIFCPWVFPMTY